MQGFPPDVLVFQLFPLGKEPANNTGHLGGGPQDFFTETNPNIGWVLGQDPVSFFTCLDIDYPDDPAAQKLITEALKTPTRVHKTPHGVQFIWRSPANTPCIRADLKGSTSVVGQLLTHGYIVGPGASVECTGSKHADGKTCGIKKYTIENPIDPQMAPPWIVALTTELHNRAHKEKNEELSGVAVGQHDKFGADIAYNLRRWGGLSEPAIKKFFQSGGLQAFIACLEGYEPDKRGAFTQADADRWAHSAAKKTTYEPMPTGLPEQADNDEETTCFGQQTFVEGILRWWIRGFIPWSQLVALYGQGGKGKSTLGSWVFGEVTKRGYDCAMWCIEESPKLFAARAILGGADRNKIHAACKPDDWRFPRDNERLSNLIESKKLKFIWFDSLYEHFEMLEGYNVAERARKILSPLAQIAREKECTIMGVFHENKSGAFLGATEMENVVRVLLKATRNPRSVRAPLKVKVAKTNMPFRPDTYMRFEADRKILIDEYTGEVQMEEVEPGKIEPLMIPIARRIEDGTNEEDEAEAVLDQANRAPYGAL